MIKFLDVLHLFQQNLVKCDKMENDDSLNLSKSSVSFLETDVDKVNMRTKKSSRVHRLKIVFSVFLC